MSNDSIDRRRRGPGSGLVFVVTGPSGAGKNSVIDRVMEQTSDLSFSVSYTTRAPRPGEIHGVDYFFVSREQFAERLRQGDFIEHVTYLGDLYGTSCSHVEALSRQGTDVILNIEVEGARSLRQSGIGTHSIVYVFLVPSTLDHLAERLRARGSEDEAEISRRLEVAAQEMKALNLFDYLVINDAFDDAVNELQAIVLAERTRITSS
jgi:guanylate kinase